MFLFYQLIFLVEKISFECLKIINQVNVQMQEKPKRRINTSPEMFSKLIFIFTNKKHVEKEEVKNSVVK